MTPRARGVHVDDGFLDVLHLGGGEVAKRIELRVEVFGEVQEFVVLGVVKDIRHFPRQRSQGLFRHQEEEADQVGGAIGVKVLRLGLGLE